MARSLFRFQELQEEQEQQEHQTIGHPSIQEEFVQPPVLENEEEGPFKYMVTDDFSPIQMHIVTSRISGLSYSRIRWEERPMYNRQISKCLKYSSLGLT